MRSLSTLERIRLTAGSAVMALVDPRRADMVALVGDLTSSGALRRLCARIRSDANPEGREMLSLLEPVRFPGDSAALDGMRSLPDGTLGREYARFMDRRGFSPESRDVVKRGYVDGGDDMVWVLQRYRDVHDLWHVLTGMPTTLLGEIAQKWFEAAHTGLPVATLSALSGPVTLAAKQRHSQNRALITTLIPWAVSAGRNANNLLAIKYENYLDQDLDALRAQWNIPPITLTSRHSDLTSRSVTLMSYRCIFCRSPQLRGSGHPQNTGDQIYTTRVESWLRIALTVLERTSRELR